MMTTFDQHKVNNELSRDKLIAAAESDLLLFSRGIVDDKDAVLDHLTKVLTFRMFNMCLMCKLDNREDEARTRANLHRVEPLEFATENKKLLDAIDEYDQF